MAKVTIFFGHYCTHPLRSTHLGKALRIDVNTGDEQIPYLVPEDNPFVNDSVALPEIYALGFRNPWRCTVDVGDGTGKW